MPMDRDNGHSPLMGELRFAVTALRPLIEHATAAADHRWPYGWPVCTTCGQVLADLDGNAEPAQDPPCHVGAQHTPGQAQAGLLWQKGDSTFLTSNGMPPLVGEGQQQVRVYADGYEPGTRDLWTRTQQECGGDDFVELIVLDEDLVADLARQDARGLVVAISRTTYDVFVT